MRRKFGGTHKSNFKEHTNFTRKILEGKITCKGKKIQYIKKGVQEGDGGRLPSSSLQEDCREYTHTIGILIQGVQTYKENSKEIFIIKRVPENLESLMCQIFKSK